MVLFGHIGITSGLAFKLENRVRLKYVALLAIAPDFFDKPLALLFPGFFLNNTRLFAHSLLGCVVVTLMLLAFRKKVKYPWVYAFAFSSHLLLDRLWEYNLTAFFWPVLGWFPPETKEPLERWLTTPFSTYNMAGEALGILILLYLRFQSKKLKKQ